MTGHADPHPVRELLEAYALGALEPAERDAVDAHLPTCGACRAELDALADALGEVDFMIASIPAEPPPAPLRQRVLEAVEPAARELSPARPPRLAGLRLRVVSAAAVVALLVLAISLVRVDQLSHSLAQERQQRAELAAIVEDREVVLEVVDSATTVRRVLRATTPDSRSYGKLFTRPDLAHVVAMAARLPQAPEGERYLLWLTLDGRQFLAGAFDVNADGFGQLVLDADRNGPLYESALVTLQATSDAAEGQRVLTWPAATP